MRPISNAVAADSDGVDARLAAGRLNGRRAGHRIYALHISNPSSSNPNQQEPFVLGSSSGGNANETETMGEVIFNPQLELRAF